MKEFIIHIPAFGTLLNTFSALLGGLVGLSIHSKLPDRFRSICFQALGLFTMVAGISMALSSRNMIIMVLSIVAGSLIGEALRLDDRISGLGSGHGTPRKGGSGVREAFITASLLYCTGTMGVLGAIEEGLGGTPHLLIAKSLLDGTAAVTLASSMGAGVVLAAVPILVYQGSITLFAFHMQDILTKGVIDEISGVGGLILIGIALDLLGIKKLRVMNMLPALAVAFILALYFSG